MYVQIFFTSAPLNLLNYQYTMDVCWTDVFRIHRVAVSVLLLVLLFVHNNSLTRISLILKSFIRVHNHIFQERIGKNVEHSE